MIPVTADNFNKSFPLGERELLAEMINKLSDKFENVVVIAAHLTPIGDDTTPVAAAFFGSDKFKSNVSKKMYEQFYKKEESNEKD
jgi:cell division GTPase FtsZ